MPRAPGFDNTLALLREGYSFIPSRCRSLGSDAFVTRLMPGKVVCASGEDAARMFYEPGRSARRGALPRTALRLLKDEGSALQLDGEAHRRRREMFLSLMTPASVGALVEAMTHEWIARIDAWRRAGELATVELMKAAVRILATRMRYEVPEQDLSIDLARMPAMPRSRFVIRNVRAVIRTRACPVVRRSVLILRFRRRTGRTTDPTRASGRA